MAMFPVIWMREERVPVETEKERERTRVREDRSRHGGKQRGQVENGVLN